jgi:hypothetical protein
VDSCPQLFIFIPFTPYRTHGVDDKSASKVARMGKGGLGMSDWTMLPHPLAAFRLDRWSTLPNDSTRHACAVFEVGVGGINDHINGFKRNIALDNIK